MKNSTVTIPSKLFSKDLLTNIFRRREKRAPVNEEFNDTTPTSSSTVAKATADSSHLDAQTNGTPAPTIQLQPEDQFRDCESPLTEVPRDALNDFSIQEGKQSEEEIVESFLTTVNPTVNFPIPPDQIWEEAQGAEPGDTCLIAWSFDRTPKLNVSKGIVTLMRKRGSRS